MYVLIGILLLGILIAVHEFGHFMAARICGIEVMEFAIGFGPKIVGWTGKSGTKFAFRCIPLGGYCAFYGEDDVDGKHKDDPRAYNKQSVWKRMFSVIMGPMMNFILAFVVATVFYWCAGAAEVTSTIDQIEAGRPAASAGIAVGDRIIGVNGVDMSERPATEIREAVNGAEPVTVTILRGEETFETTITPFWDEELQRYRIGITFGSRSVPLPFMQAVEYSWSYCVEAGTLIVRTLGEMVTKGEHLDEVGGPVGAVATVSQAVQQEGWTAFVGMLVMISVNLGVMNLLPIPGLDGSRFIFMVIEAVRGKPVKPEREAMVHMIGMLFLFALMIWFTFKDIIRLFQ
ncbi:MAG: site-2 protease family protein [Clostridia bacterium]|nr:site-2 protease family protein [Clostridia bacterium]